MLLNNIEIKDLGIILKPGTKSKRHYYTFNCSDCNLPILLTKADLEKRTTTQCLKCNKISLMQKRAAQHSQVFVDKAMAVHGTKYTYAQVVYINSKEKVKIHCNEHDWDFYQRPFNHLKGEKCPKCAGTYKPTNSEYDKQLLDKNITEIIRIDNYINAVTPIAHKHSCGHTWSITPHNVLYGHSCPICTKTTDGDVLYIWRVEETNVYKIGITSERLGYKRIKEVARKANITNYTIVLFEVMKNARDLETFLHKHFKIQPSNLTKTDGHTEFRILTKEDITYIKGYINEQKQN